VVEGASRAILRETKVAEQEFAVLKAKYNDSYFEEMTREATQAYLKLRMACRADLGEQNLEFNYSKYKTARGVNFISHCDHADTVDAAVCHGRPERLEALMVFLIPYVSSSFGPQSHKNYCGTEVTTAK
jgi:hypothetical protein